MRDRTRQGPLAVAVVAWVIMVGVPADGWAQRVDLSFYGGQALPRYEESIRFAPALPQLPGYEVTASDALALDAAGGPVFGGAIALEFGFLALEGRVDTADVDLETAGVRIDLRPVGRPIVASVSIGAGQIDLDRFVVYSANLRLRTPGPVSFFASGGISYLPSLSASGTLPVAASIVGLPGIGTSAGLRLEAEPSDADSRFGGNAGAGLRVTLAPHVALFGEARIFGFQEYDLRFVLDDSDLAGLDEFVEFPSVQFTPVYFHAAAGLTFAF